MVGDGAHIDCLVRRWEGIEVGPPDRGIVEYFIGRRQIGHVHGDVLVDIPFPKRFRDAIVADRRGSPHHNHPESGWVSVWLRTEEDMAHALDLLRQSYEMAVARRDELRRLRASE